MEREQDPQARLPNWVLGIAGVLIAGGILASIATAIRLTSAVEVSAASSAIRFETLNTRISTLEASIAEGTRNRYTAEQAASDRLVLSQTISNLAASITRIMAIEDENTKQIQELRLFRAKAEERGGIK